MALKVWQLDPAQITPFYNLVVCEAGCSVRYFTSQYLYDMTLGESELVDVYQQMKNSDSR